MRQPWRATACVDVELIANPGACSQGELVTWAKLSAIQANCGIETTLDACMLKLAEVVPPPRRRCDPLSPFDILALLLSCLLRALRHCHHACPALAVLCSCKEGLSLCSPASAS